jgi:ribosomal protein S18 acetylase RimI-like enzyme
MTKTRPRPRATSRGGGTPPLTADATPLQLAAAVQRNQAEWIRFEGRLPEVEPHADRDVMWVCSASPGHPNSVALARFDEDDAEDRIAEVVAEYRRVGASTVWWVGSLSSPPDLGRRLRDTGFHCIKHFPGMALDMRRMCAGTRTIPGLKLSRVSDFSIFERHEHPFFGPMTTERRRNFLDGERILCSVKPTRAFAFVATVAGEALGHALVFLGAGVAGVFDVGVVRRARGRGIGKAVTLAALRHARKLGYRYAVLQASGEGEHLYRTIGFEEVCRISLWFLSKNRDGKVHG